MSMKPIKIVMMGGERVGKTSLLAGLVDTMRNDCRVSNVMSLNSRPHEENNLGVLNEKITSLRKKISSASLDNYFLVEDNEKTGGMIHYDLIINPPNNPTCKIWLQFIDISGEDFIEGAKENNETASIIKESDVCLVAIDTPFLMEATEPQCRLYNRVDCIQRFLAELDDNNGMNAKLVLFVPIKCEKWAQDDKLNDVKDRVVEIYRTPIQNLKGFKNIEIDIVPVQTCGSIVFVEQLEGKLYEIDNVRYRCSQISPDKIRVEDGTVYDLDPSKISSDIHGRRGRFMMPYSWFKLLSHEYKPYNCEQVVYLILLFTYSKRNFNNMLYAALEQIREEQEHANFFRRVINHIYIVSAYFTLFIERISGHFDELALYASIMNEKFCLLPSHVVKDLMEKISRDLNYGKDGIRIIQNASLLGQVKSNSN